MALGAATVHENSIFVLNDAFLEWKTEWHSTARRLITDSAD
jgi:hypothetical protein